MKLAGALPFRRSLHREERSHSERLVPERTRGVARLGRNSPAMDARELCCRTGSSRVRSNPAIDEQQEAGPFPLCSEHWPWFGYVSHRQAWLPGVTPGDGRGRWSVDPTLWPSVLVSAGIKTEAELEIVINLVFLVASAWIVGEAHLEIARAFIRVPLASQRIATLCFGASVFLFAAKGRPTSFAERSTRLARYPRSRRPSQRHSTLLNSTEDAS